MEIINKSKCAVEDCNDIAKAEKEVEDGLKLCFCMKHLRAYLNVEDSLAKTWKEKLKLVKGY